MQFLVTTRPQPNITPPPDVWVDLIPEAQNWLKSEQKQGRIDYVASFCDGSGGIAVVNAQTPEELNARLMDYPLALFTQFEVQCLIEVDRALDAARGAYTKAAAQL